MRKICVMLWRGLVGKIKDIIKFDFGKPLHSVVLCAQTLSSIEKEVFEFYSK